MCVVLETCPPLGLPQGEVTYSRLFPTNPAQRGGLHAKFSCPTGYIHHGARGAFCSEERKWKNTNEYSQNAVCAGKGKVKIKVLMS